MSTEPDKSNKLTNSGIYEFVFGGDINRKDEYLTFWKTLGFTPTEKGAFNSSQARKFYGHDAELLSIRLKHPGCDTFNTGLVRLQLWSRLRNQGLDGVKPVECGSRWMGFYTHDVMQLHDSFSAESSLNRWNLDLSPIVNAPLQNPTPVHDFDQPFVGLRELLVFGNDFRLAFIQRGGFDRPGFGTFDDSLPYKNTEGSHANIVQPANSFSTDFYKNVFDFETAPFGEPHDSGGEPPTIKALQLKPGELFHIERIRAGNCPSGLLQVYSSYQEGEDYRDLSRAGSRSLCAYSVNVSDMSAFKQRLSAHEGHILSQTSRDEFNKESVSFTAPDGYFWLATSGC